MRFTAYINNPDGLVDLAFTDVVAAGETKGEAVEALAHNLPHPLPYRISSVTVVDAETFVSETYPVQLGN